MFKDLKKMIANKLSTITYKPEDYNCQYYLDMDNGVNYNPVSFIHSNDLASTIEGIRVLSIGCGTGIMEYRIKKLLPDIDIIGTDFMETTIQRDLWNKYDLKVIIADAIQQPFPDNSFDTVYSSHVLEHVPKPFDVIKESIRLTNNLAFHMIPINLNNPDHIHFFKFDKIDNEYRTQEATIDLKKMADKIIKEFKSVYPKICYELKISCPRDGSHDYGDQEFPVKKIDRPDGLMPAFIIKFYKYGKI